MFLPIFGMTRFFCGCALGGVVVDADWSSAFLTIVSISACEGPLGFHAA